MGPHPRLSRRSLVLGGGLLAARPGVAAASSRGDPQALPARWVGVDPARGHRLRGAPASLPTGAPAAPRRTDWLVIGGGVAGLAAARRAVQRGQDVHVLELDDVAGGHSRGHHLGGTGCPLGAHYLPVPQPPAHELREWLFELGLLRLEAGREVADERHLCHSPQERLYFEGAWREGLLPPADPASRTMAQYRRMERLVAALGATGRGGRTFALPTHRARPTAEVAELDRWTFGAWLEAQGLDDSALRWYLDHVCLDDHGAGASTVSAWAGVHYFASRHGFSSPDGAGDPPEPVFTWPQGNAWLVARLLQPLQGRVHTGRTVLSVSEDRHGLDVLAWDTFGDRPERWRAERVVMAVPLFVARRLLRAPPPPVASALQAVAAEEAATPRASWLVANLHLRGPWVDRVGLPLAWDSVIFGARNLGYVHAQHQELGPRTGGNVVSVYLPLPAAARGDLLARSPGAWAAEVLADVQAVHPDWPTRLQAAELARWGHAMAVPAPGVWRSMRDGPRAALRRWRGRVRFAHADLAGYSVFEEAFTAGHQAIDAAAPS